MIERCSIRSTTFTNRSPVAPEIDPGLRTDGQDRRMDNRRHPDRLDPDRPRSDGPAARTGSFGGAGVARVQGHDSGLRRIDPALGSGHDKARRLDRDAVERSGRGRQRNQCQQREGPQLGQYDDDDTDLLARFGVVHELAQHGGERRTAFQAPLRIDATTVSTLSEEQLTALTADPRIAELAEAMLILDRQTGTSRAGRISACSAAMPRSTWPDIRKSCTRSPYWPVIFRGTKTA